MKYILILAIVWFFVNFLKILIDAVNHRSSWKRLMNYGGMPSSHSAFVFSLCTIVYLVDGINVTLAISLVFAAIVVYDAIGLRGFISEHSRVLNRLIKELPDAEEYKFPLLEERIAHTLVQLIAGGIIGILSTIILYYWI